MISGARLAWLQLRRQKGRFAVAIAGVAFAVILMFMQFGFQDALFNSAVNVHMRLKGDLFFFHPHYNVLAFPSQFPRVRLYQALAFDGVESVTPVYTGTVPWKNPETGRTRDIFILGIDPVADAFDLPEVNAQVRLTREPDVVLFDEYSRPEFGPIVSLFKEGKEVSTEARNRRVTVGGLFKMGTSFGVDGTIYTSDLNYLRINPHMTLGKPGIGIVRLKPGADPKAVQAAMRAHLPQDVKIVTKQEMIDHEVGYWATATPIGFVFTFGVIMGLVVGMIIVYQILFADISDHLKEYATLKAMGYTNRYLAAVVLFESSILGLAGFVPGVALCERLYVVTKKATMLPMAIEPVRATQVLVLTLVMCWASALIAVRKLRAADPADVF
ncbi:MAG TPA: ABC transporter permease DevC [Candidatus Eisenbacteria bacterium]|nr:ABC transporter permease DevC [Candidatus Eisenbacteria bacterium]